MIKFFRKIRFHLLNEGKVTRYLTYAIGEIVLVVIGIMIALSINNWNTSRIQHQKEQVYLQNILRDLEQQAKLIENQMSYELNIFKKASPIIREYKQNQQLTIDSIFTNRIGELAGRMTFIRQNPTFTEMLSSGNLDILRQVDFKNKLIQYNYELERVEIVLNKNNNLFVDEVFIPEVMHITEVQLHSIFSVIEFIDFFSDTNFSSEEFNVDLNVDQLKKITIDSLEEPEKELMLLNMINYRNKLGLIHYSLLKKLKRQTEELIVALKEFENE